MQKLNDIKQVIKILEECILNDDEYIPSGGLNIKSNLEDLLIARRVLLWVVKVQPKKNKVDNKSKKLEEFNIKTPL